MSRPEPHSGTGGTGAATGSTSRDRLAVVLKWVGAATAVLTLLFGVQRLSEMITGSSAQRREVAELLASAQVFQQAADYAGAWSALERAAGLDGRNEEIRRARESLAMVWLENIRVRSGEGSFSDIVGQLSPVLARGAAAERGSRQADLLAHLGWGEFLRSREGGSGRPDDYYRQALDADPDNVYAHAMLGHLTLWRGGRIEEARTHFDAALRSGREGGFVRQLQFAAYRNMASEAGDAALVRFGAEMHAAGEPVDATMRAEIFRRYEMLLRAPCTGAAAGLPEAAAAPGVPIDGQLAAFEWLFDQPEFPESDSARREYYRGCLLEAGGRTPEALERYRLAQSQLPPASSLESAVATAIERLSRGAPR